MKRIVALILLVCLCMTVCGCGGRSGAAILCVYEGQPAAQALAGQGENLSWSLASTDVAALQQLDSGACDYALVTQQGFAAVETDAVELEAAILGVFCIVSRADALRTWTVDTRVTVVGEADGYGDQLAQQALTCALHGSVRYMEREAALTALKKGQTDVVMGLFAPQDQALERLLGKKKDAQLLSMPEGLLNVKLPDASMEAYALTLDGQTAQTYALLGVVAARENADKETTQSVLQAARDAGLIP